MPGASITGPDGIYGAAATNWTIGNHGTLIGTDVAGIYFGQGGTVTNEPVGVITGIANGVLITGDRGTIRNAGTITEAAIGGAAVSLANGGLVDNNASTASIAADSTGVYIAGQSGTVLNQGAITGALFPIYLKSIGVVSNAATGLIEGALRHQGLQRPHGNYQPGHHKCHRDPGRRLRRIPAGTAERHQWQQRRRFGADPKLLRR